ncbi:MAG: hypothetical protein ACLUYS_03180, partial [Allobaculum sp.]|uniref:hypothetical protein n=1 Tax=Allobaculum sp. TaxID=1872463 RepID=UPI00399A822F
LSQGGGRENTRLLFDAYFHWMAVRFSIQFSSKSGKQIALIRKGFPNLDRSAPEETGKIGKVSCFRNGRGEASDFPFFQNRCLEDLGLLIRSSEDFLYLSYRNKKRR